MKQNLFSTRKAVVLVMFFHTKMKLGPLYERVYVLFLPISRHPYYVFDNLFVYHSLLPAWMLHFHLENKQFVNEKKPQVYGKWTYSF